MKEFYLRFLSSLFLGPVFLLCILLEGYFLLVVVLVIAFILSWEWQGLTLDSKRPKISKNVAFLIQGCMSSIGVITLLAPATMSTEAFSELELATFLSLIGGSILLYLLRFSISTVWGILYIGIFVQSLIMIVLSTNTLFVFRLITLVWTCDIGGYFFGRFGGPKLAPFISPNKTWIGFAGSLVSVFALNMFFETFVPWYKSEWSITPYWSSFYILAVVISAVLGDLFISLLKRKAKVKSTGKIIPGHGGLLDRFDSFIVVIIFTAFMQVGERILN